MLEHPENYTLTREEWSLVNRALCGARLEMQFPSKGNRKERLIRVAEALDIISHSYARAKEAM